jgi:hypothetical protein
VPPKQAQPISASSAPSAIDSTPPDLHHETSPRSSQPLGVDLSDIIAKTSVELKRLGWTEAQGREHLQQVYGKRSRQHLTDPELLHFLTYLESLPT